MTTVYRLVGAGLVDRAFSGEGARRYGGRWNPVGWPIVYTSGSRALAVLETLVHLAVEVRHMAFAIIAADLPDDAVIESYRGPEASWRPARAIVTSQRIGERWFRAGGSLALRVPSAIVPEEDNFLLNVEHEDFKRVTIGATKTFAFDERLWKLGPAQ